MQLNSVSTLEVRKLGRNWKLASADFEGTQPDVMESGLVTYFSHLFHFATLSFVLLEADLCG